MGPTCLRYLRACVSRERLSQPGRKGWSEGIVLAPSSASSSIFRRVVSLPSPLPGTAAVAASASDGGRCCSLICLALGEAPGAFRSKAVSETDVPVPDRRGGGGGCAEKPTPGLPLT